MVCLSSAQVTTTDVGLIPMPVVVQPRFDSTAMTQMCPLSTATPSQQCPVSLVYTVPRQNSFLAINPATIEPITNPTTVNATVVQPPSSKRFEVEDVAEVDSPIASDLSSHSSTENLERALGRSEEQDVTTNSLAPATGELENTSGSSIGIEMAAEHAPDIPFPISHVLEHPTEIPSTMSHVLEQPQLQLTTSHVLEQHPQLPLVTSQMENPQIPMTMPQMTVPPVQMVGPSLQMVGPSLQMVAPPPVQTATSHLAERPPLYAQTELPTMPRFTHWNVPVERPQMHTWHHPEATHSSILGPVYHQPEATHSSILGPVYHQPEATHSSILGPVYHQPGHPTVSDPGLQTAWQCSASVGYVNTTSYCPSALVPISESHFRHSTSSVPDLERMQYLHQSQQRPEPTVHIAESHIHTSDSQFHHTPPVYSNGSTSTAPSSQSLQGEAALANFPHADLLSHAFMRFIHSMSTVLRDPAIRPLLESLDQKFTPPQENTDLNPPTGSPRSSSPTLTRHTAPQVRITQHSHVAHATILNVLLPSLCISQDAGRETATADDDLEYQQLLQQ